MGPLRIVLIVIALLLGAAAAWYFWPREAEPQRVEISPAPPPPVAQAPKFPVQPPEAPLPGLKESDPALIEVLSGLVGAEPVKKLLHLEEIVRNIVATVDNLPRRNYASRLLPVKPPGGLMRTSGKDASLAIAPENAARYAPYVRFLDAAEPGKLAAAYLRFYPLFQQAYVELGYPNGYFNDRLVEVIDHLLATPEVAGPIRLVVPKVLYEYADPELEERSGGQKVLLRMGSANATRTKAWLKAFREEVIARAAKR